MSDSNKILFYNNREVEHIPFYETRKYGYQYQNFDNEKLTKEIHYEVEINCKTRNSNNDFVYEINRKQIYVNQKEPELLIEQLLEKCSKVIFPVKIVPYEDGTIAEIYNHSEIVERWRSLRDQLSTYYYSDIAYKVLNKIQNLILNKEELEKSLNQDWLFHLYFAPIYIDYPLEKPQNYSWKSPLFGNQVVEYKVAHTIEENYTPTRKIIINAKGKNSDERSIAEVLRGINYPRAKLQGKQYKPIESEMQVQYKLYGEDKTIFSIIATYKTKINETKNKIQKIGLYHLVKDDNFKPESDEQDRKARAQFERMQHIEDEDIIDISKVSRKMPSRLNPLYEKPRKSVELFVEEIPTVKKRSLIERLTGLFRKNKN